MRIAQLAPLAESVPPSGYGGTEQVVSLLTEELVRRGHEVTLFATSDSRTSAELIACAPEGLRSARGVSQTRWPAYDLRLLMKLDSMKDRFDVVHNHMGYISFPFLRNFKSPNVTTNHNLVSDYCAEIYLTCRQLPLVAISDAYRRLNYPEQLNYVATIHNGVDLDAFSFADSSRQRSLLFLGRICAAKGTVEAIGIARRLDMPIVVAGKVDKNDQQYFDELVRPLLSEPGVEFAGEVSAQEKIKLYSEAVATLCPISFDEPFGLVLAESLACGTPVMALRRGAVPEVVSDGETGIVGDTVEELINRFDQIERISRRDCRRRAQQHFSKEKMAEQYEKLYLQLTSGKVAIQGAAKS
ncbi:MAG: glycosyltransferase family 4 protein [Candidatus Melainabacteria bacterium]|nr:glycosyltransferase family 4 protein [Candidatus Melainabacteria bacterium]